MPQKFITFEGPDGAGKTTVMKEIAQRLTDRGLSVVCTRDPGGTKLAEDIRQILLSPASKIEPCAEALLYAAARAQLVAEVILPALLSDKVVLCDRFVGSSYAYQGDARGLGAEYIEAINKPAIEKAGSFFTILLHINPEIGAKRSAGKDRMEQEGLRFRQDVEFGYWQYWARNSKNIYPIDASYPIEKVCEEALNAVLDYLKGETEEKR